MVKLTEELLRKRAEHNDGNLADLEEIALHQYEIERIEPLLGERCRRLRILLLQNNLIARIENLQRLRDLRYLNLALNNVRRVEGLEQLEHLERLDLTANYIDDLSSVETLRACRSLRDLYLTGNPCARVDCYRDFVILALPQLEALDGEAVTRTERLSALQREREVRARALAAPVALQEGFSPEERLRVYRELAARKEELERAKAPPPQPKREAPPLKVRSDGRVPQMNQGAWEFRLDDQGDALTLEVALPRFLDTSLIDVDAQPLFVRIVAKGKALQLNFPEEVRPDSGTAVRSQTTGRLLLTFPKVCPGEHVAAQPVLAKIKDEHRQAPNREQQREELRGTVDVHSIVGEKKQGPAAPVKDEHPEVPPLE